MAMRRLTSNMLCVAAIVELVEINAADVNSDICGGISIWLYCGAAV
jgi:hypothetical protein